MNDILTSAEAGAALGLFPGDLTKWAQADPPRIARRIATAAELAALQASGRLSRRTGPAAWVYERAAVEALAATRKRGAGRPVTTGAGLARKDRRSATGTPTEAPATE
jgi:hypothetical protein